jgi:hypothetical protein
MNICSVYHDANSGGRRMERLTEALVQPGAAVLIGSGDVPLWITHDDEGSAPFRRDVMPSTDERRDR